MFTQSSGRLVSGGPAENGLEIFRTHKWDLAVRVERQRESPQGWSLGSRAARPGLRFQTRYSGTQPLSHHRDHCAQAPALASSRQNFQRTRVPWVRGRPLGLRFHGWERWGWPPSRTHKPSVLSLRSLLRKSLLFPPPSCPWAHWHCQALTPAVKGPAPSQAPAGFPSPRQGH